MLSENLIQGSIQSAGLKGFAGFYLLPTFPPPGISIIKYALNCTWFAGLLCFIPLFFL
jgi:hypothetical protein